MNKALLDEEINLGPWTLDVEPNLQLGFIGERGKAAATDLCFAFRYIN